MARIAGVNIPTTNMPGFAMTAIFGIGNTRARKICDDAGVMQIRRSGSHRRRARQNCVSRLASSRSKATCAVKSR